MSVIKDNFKKSRNKMRDQQVEGKKQKQRLHLYAILQRSSKTGAQRSFVLLDKNVTILFSSDQTHKKLLSGLLLRLLSI